MKYLPQINSPADLKALSVEQLVELSEEVRREIIAAVSETGGHLASNLGIVELTIALHYLLDLPSDKLIWDVSHQTYAHKLLTGRREQIHTIRQYRGLAGYAKRTESEYDCFGAGHASTSISAALGFAVARDLAGKDHKVVAVIGDGAMTGGLAFEGMNNAGAMKRDLLVVLNDNTWSISKNVGSISKYLTGIMSDEKFNKLRNEIWELTGRFKRRDRIRETVSRLERSVKALLVPGMFFEKLGFRYFGPIDGHDLPLLIKTLSDIRNLHGPVMLHIATTKGKGFAPAEGDAITYHGVGRFDKVTGKAAPSSNSLPDYTTVFGDSIVELAQKDKRVVAITAAMCSGTGLTRFSEEFPDRFFDVGIAEAHAACFGAALAADGARPYVTVYSTFMQRAYDQIIHDMAIQNLPVVICMDRAGVVGNDGPTHHGVFDLSYLATIPNVTIAAPKDGNELRSMLHYTIDHDPGGVVAIRYPRDKVPVPMKAEPEPIKWGTWEWLVENDAAVILAVGPMSRAAQKAAERLAEDGTTVGVVNVRFVKPLDMAVLEKIRESANLIVTVEENSLRGGFGEGIAEYLLASGYEGRFLSLGIRDQFVTHGTREELLRDVGLDADGIYRSISRLVEQSEKSGGGLFSKLGLKRSGHARKKIASE